LISIIISTWNSIEHIGKCISSIRSVGLGDYEIIVVDAGSRDDTIEYLKSLKDERVRLINPNKRLKWSDANQIGLEAAKGDWLCLSNPDIVFNDGFKLMIQDCERLGINVAAPQLIWPNGELQRPAKLVTPWTALCLFSRIFRLYYMRTGRRDRYMEPYQKIPFIVGCPQGSLFMVHRKVLERLRGHLWNKGYQNGFSDLEAFLNMRREGFPLWLFPQYQIVHYGSYVTKRYPTWIERDQANGFVLYFRYWQRKGTPRIGRWISPRLISFLFAADGIAAALVELAMSKLRHRPFWTPIWNSFMAGERILGLIDGWKYRI